MCNPALSPSEQRPHPRPVGHPLSINGDGERHLPAADVRNFARGTFVVGRGAIVARDTVTTPCYMWVNFRIAQSIKMECNVGFERD